MNVCFWNGLLNPLIILVIFGVKSEMFNFLSMSLSICHVPGMYVRVYGSAESIPRDPTKGCPWLRLEPSALAFDNRNCEMILSLFAQLPLTGNMS